MAGTAAATVPCTVASVCARRCTVAAGSTGLPWLRCSERSAPVYNAWVLLVEIVR